MTMKLYFCPVCAALISAQDPEDTPGAECLNCGTVLDTSGTIVGEFDAKDAETLLSANGDIESETEEEDDSDA